MSVSGNSHSYSLTVTQRNGKLDPVTTPDAATDPRHVPPTPDIAFLTMAVGRRVRAKVDAALDQHGLTYRHLSALGHLAGNPDLSYAELARRGGVTTQSMQATLAQLQQRGAVEQRNPAKRGLRAQLRLTPTGTDLLRLGAAALDSVEEQLVATLSAEQRTHTAAGLFAVFTALLADDTSPPRPRNAD